MVVRKVVPTRSLSTGKTEEIAAEEDRGDREEIKPENDCYKRLQNGSRR